HALIGVSHPRTISRVVQSIKWISARRLNDKRRASGPVWQHPFWDRFVRHEKEVAARFDYMHLNPVRKQRVSKPQEWRWSSYDNYAVGSNEVKRCPLRIDYVRLPESYRG
ncbi:MAG: transposase, partial [Terriglobia bacterium]